MRYDETVDKILQNTDIVEYIGRTVQLKRTGANFKGLCPFHGEKTPSFVVSPEKQIFTCFGCGETGNIISFVRKTQSLDFMDALELLAGEAGIEIERRSSRTDEKKDKIYEISRDAARYYYKTLRTGDNPGIRYVLKRGISPETAAKFGIGYAADGWQNLEEHLGALSRDKELASEAGLLGKGKGDRYYDKFRNRLIFPIINTRNKVIGFGGRAIDDTMPKYLNSPETLVFKKKDNLYGLNLAKASIRENNLALMVEGYMDVVSLYDAGIQNVVASLGTALTIEQARLLKRYTDTVVLSYDADSAGQAATMRGIDILTSAGLRVKVLQVKDGKDPDEFIKKHGKSAFDELIRDAVPFMNYKIETIKARFDISSTEGSIGFLEAISGEIRKISSSVEQAAYIKMVSEMTKIPESSLQREVEGQGKQVRNPVYNDNTQNQPGPESSSEPHLISKKKSPVVRMLIKLMTGNSSCIPIIRDTKEFLDYFTESGYEGVAKSIFDAYTPDSEINLQALMDNMEDSDRLLLKDVEEKILAPADERKALLDCAARIQSDNLSARRREILKIMEILDEETDGEQINKLSAELIAVNEAITKLQERKEQLNG